MSEPFANGNGKRGWLPKPYFSPQITFGNIISTGILLFMLGSGLAAVYASLQGQITSMQQTQIAPLSSGYATLKQQEEETRRLLDTFANMQTQIVTLTTTVAKLQQQQEETRRRTDEEHAALAEARAGWQSALGGVSHDLGDLRVLVATLVAGQSGGKRR